MSFRTQQKEQKIDSGFEQKLRDIVNKRAMLGISGVQYSDKNYLGSTYTMNTEMQESVIALGVAMRGLSGVTPDGWAAWMSDVEFYDNGDEISFFHRSEFYLNQARYRFNEVLAFHFKKKISWKISEKITQRVNVRIA